MIYVLTLQTFSEYDRAHHWYGRIHWHEEEPCDHGNTLYATDGSVTCRECGSDHSGAGFQSADSLTESGETGRHDSKESAIAGARRWYELHAKLGDCMVLGEWGLEGWLDYRPFEILEGRLP